MFSSGSLTLFGTGSEWFWSALTGVVTAITFIAIWKQLRLQASTAAREELLDIVRGWDTEKMLRMRLQAYRELLADGRMDDYSIGWEPCNYWEYVGTLARSGHMNVRVMQMTLGAHVAGWWATTSAEIARVRGDYDAPDLWENFEWLANRLSEVDSGTIADASQAVTPERLTQGIASLEKFIALEESLR